MLLASPNRKAGQRSLSLPARKARRRDWQPLALACLVLAPAAQPGLFRERSRPVQQLTLSPAPLLACRKRLPDRPVRALSGSLRRGWLAVLRRLGLWARSNVLPPVRPRPFPRLSKRHPAPL